MEPKTKLQKIVVGLSSKLAPITDKQKTWAYEKCFGKYAVRSRKTLYCLECGHSWKDGSVLLQALLGCTCPLCGCDLNLLNGYRLAHLESEYFAVLTTLGGWQVVRMIYINKCLKKLKKPEYFACEVMQHWIDQSGKVITMSMNVQGLSHYCDQWVFLSKLEVRHRGFESCPRYGIGPKVIYPERRVLPILKRNGFKGHFYGFTPQKLFSMILSRPIAETLLKADQIDLLYYTQGIIDKYWPSVKICLRNNYKIIKASDWFDYIKLLDHFEKDMHSPKYVCPENFLLAHNRLVKKKQEEDRKLYLIQLRQKLESEQKEYAKQKGRFFGLRFSNGQLLIKPLEKVEEFMVEGDQLRHCIFTNEYYKKSKSLILSARINEQPVETIEIALPELTILQALGKGNVATEYHDQIISLVQENIPRIAQRMRQKEAV